MNDKKSVKTIGTVAFMMAATVVSKGLGMLRGMLVTHQYGTGVQANAFTEASHIPLTFFDLLFSAAILGCFIPVYNSLKDKERDDFAVIFFNTVLLFTGLLTVLGIVFAEPLINLLASALPAETKILSAKLLRIMFPMIMFTGATYTLVGVMQSKGRFLLPAMISSISNLGVIVYLLFFDSGIFGLAFAYILSWLIQLLTLAVPLAVSGFRFRFRLDFKNKALHEAIRRAPPVMIGSWLTPLSLLISLSFAPFVGNVTIFDCANNVYIIISGTLTYSICNYVFPTLSRLSVEGDDESFRSIVRTGLKSSLLIILPFMFGVITFGREGIAVLYMKRAFTAFDTQLTSEVLNCLIYGMPAFAAVEILSRVFYARGLNRVPMTASFCGIAVNIIASALLVRLPGVNVYVIGISNALGQSAAAVVLIISLGVKMKGIYDKQFAADILKTAAVGLLSFAVMFVIYRSINNDPYTAGDLMNIITAVSVFIPALAVYLISAKFLRIKFSRGGD